MTQQGKLYGLDLFSGIGGNTLGLGDYVRTIAYCEQDRHAQAVLLSRMGDGSIPLAPIWDDITTLSRAAIDVPIDIIVGGFPCQDISVAGKGAGLDGERSGLFYEVVRLAKEFQPTFLFLENVPAIRTRGLDTVIQELTKIGYDCRWTMLSASDVGAPHKRERWFLLGHSSGRRFGESSERQMEQSRGAKTISSSHPLANPHQQYDKQESGSLGQASSPTRKQERGDGLVSSSADSAGQWWTTEPNMGRVANGVPQRVDRLKRLGNAVVPQQAKKAFEILMGIT
jgi:DNA (cytosine-5)-methyltransferase 1